MNKETMWFINRIRMLTTSIDLLLVDCVRQQIEDISNRKNDKAFQ